MSGVAGLVRKRLPNIHRDKIKNGDWAVDGSTKNGHIWLLHLPSGKRLPAPGSSSCYRAEKNLLSIMARFEKGEYRW